MSSALHSIEAAASEDSSGCLFSLISFLMVGRVRKWIMWRKKEGGRKRPPVPLRDSENFVYPTRFWLSVQECGSSTRLPLLRPSCEAVSEGLSHFPKYSSIYGRSNWAVIGLGRDRTRWVSE